MESFQEILKRKAYYYGCTQAAIQFALEEFLRQEAKKDLDGIKKSK